jgi:hypothetical protein
VLNGHWIGSAIQLMWLDKNMRTLLVFISNISLKIKVHKQIKNVTISMLLLIQYHFALLQYFEHPWRPDRWRDYCKQTVSYHWGRYLLQVVTATNNLMYPDTEYASVSVPMQQSQMDGLCFIRVRQTIVQSWMPWV